jgi:hypothetical protein
MDQKESFIDEADLSKHLGSDRHATAIDDIDFDQMGRVARLKRNVVPFEKARFVGLIEITPIGHDDPGIVHVKDDRAKDAELGVSTLDRFESFDKMRGDRCIVVE